jgi:hypothetical protein
MQSMIDRLDGYGTTRQTMQYSPQPRSKFHGPTNHLLGHTVAWRYRDNTSWTSFSEEWINSRNEPSKLIYKNTCIDQVTTMDPQTENIKEK